MEEKERTERNMWLVGAAGAAFLFVFSVASGAAFAAGAQQDLVTTLDNVKNLLIALGSVVASIGYAVTAYMWMSSGGNPENRAKARKYFADVTVGMFLLFLSSYLVQLAQSLVV